MGVVACLFWYGILGVVLGLLVEAIVDSVRSGGEGGDS